MKTWIILAIIVGLLAFGAFVILTNSKTVQADVVSQGTCPYGSAGCPYKAEGGCSQGANCGLDTCAAKYGGSCGCGK